MSLNNNYNTSRLEYYLSVAWSSHALPVTILSKSDLCADLSYILYEISTMVLRVDVVANSIND